MFKIEVHVVGNQEEMVSWCNENLPPWSYDFIDYPKHGYILFDDEIIATSFKLMWA